MRPFCCAHVGGHENLHDLDAVVECQHRLLAVRESADEMPVLRFVPVSSCFFRDDRHHSHLGVLLLHQIFAGFAFYFAAEEKLEPAVERIPRHRVLRPEQLGREPKSGADEAPGCRHFADQPLAVVGFVFDRRARKILRRGACVIDVLAHRG